MINQGVRS